MHVAIVSHCCLPHVGGVEVVVEALASRLVKRHTVTQLSSDWGGTSGAERDGARTIWRLPSLHASEQFGVPYPVPLGPHVREAMAEVARAGVVHVHGALYAQTVLARRAARRGGAALVLTEHVGPVAYPSAALNALQRWAWSGIGSQTAAQADAVTTLGSRVSVFLQRYVTPGAVIEVIPNGVDLERFAPATDAQRSAARATLGLPADGVLVLFVGRAAAKKNLDALLTIPRIGWTLVTCGAARTSRPDGVIDLGVRSPLEMVRAYHACDVLAHPAEGEGFPLAVQEAMASGLPAVVRWEAGYEATLARDVAHAADEMPAFAEVLGALVSDAAARRASGARGRAWAEARWGWDATVAAYERVYDAAITRRRERAH